MSGIPPLVHDPRSRPTFDRVWLPRYATWYTDVRTGKVARISSCEDVHVRLEAAFRRGLNFIVLNHLD